MKQILAACCVAGGLLLGIGNVSPVPAPATDIDGRQIYVQTCAACHANGVAGAPRFGHREDWAERLATGRIELARSVLRGKGGMPPKGGNASLTDAHAMAALDHILSGLR